MVHASYSAGFFETYLVVARTIIYGGIRYFAMVPRHVHLMVHFYLAVDMIVVDLP